MSYKNFDHKVIKNLYFERKRALRKMFLDIKETFPFISQKKILYFKRKYNLYDQKLKNLSQDNGSLFLFLELFLASLKNSHTKLGQYPTKKFFKPKGYSVFFVNKKFYLQKNNESVIGEILKIDNQKPQAILNYHIKRISASTKQYALYRAFLFLLTDQEGEPINLKVKRSNGKIDKVFLPRRKIITAHLKEFIESKMIKKHLAYLKIKAWDGNNTQDLLDKRISYFIRNKARFLIIDLRGNGGGDARIARHFAGHFFNKRVLFGSMKQRISKRNLKLKRFFSYVEPVKPYSDSRLILLVDVSCLSSNEYFISGLKDNKRAFLIGETTGGSSGNPRKFIIPYNRGSFEVYVSTWLFYRLNEKPLEGRGVTPDLIVKQSLSDFINKRDRILEVAVKQIQKLV